ncbi:MAG: hypothetical protein VW378_06245 [bacterium]
MTIKPFFLALRHFFLPLWDEGVDVLVLTNFKNQPSNDDKMPLFSGMLIFKDQLFMTFSKDSQRYQFFYDLNHDIFKFNGAPVSSSLYYDESRLSIRWFFEALEKKQLVLLEGVKAAVVSSKFYKSSFLQQMNLPFSSEFDSKQEVGAPLRQGSHRICVTQSVDWEQLLTFYSNLQNYHLYDARPKIRDFFVKSKPYISLSRYYNSSIESDNMAQLSVA